MYVSPAPDIVTHVFLPFLSVAPGDLGFWEQAAVRVTRRGRAEPAEPSLAPLFLCILLFLSSFPLALADCLTFRHRHLPDISLQIPHYSSPSATALLASLTTTASLFAVTDRSTPSPIILDLAQLFRLRVLAHSGSRPQINADLTAWTYHFAFRHCTCNILSATVCSHIHPLTLLSSTITPILRTFPK